MKKVFLTLCTLAISLLVAPQAFAQDRLASFEGGQKALQAYIAQNATFPDEAMDNQAIDGRVYLAAEVQEDGSLDKIKVVRKLHPVLDKAAILLAEKMPKWLPAMKDGKASKQIVSFCIPYKYDVTPVATDGRPSFIGGQEACQKFLSKNLYYPEELLMRGIEGQVIVKFSIEKNGDVTNPKIIYSPNPKFNDEVLRFFAIMPKWIPAMRGDTSIKSNMTMPIRFSIDPRVKEAIQKNNIQKVKRLVEELGYKKR